MTIYEAIENAKNGAITRVGYTSDVSVAAAFKKVGISIKKFTEMTCRLGVDYDNIESVIEKKEQRLAEGYIPQQRENNYHWIIKNKIAHNDKTGLDYLRITTIPNNNSHIKYYELNDNGNKSIITEEEVKKYAIASYWNKSSDPVEVFNVKLDNVFKIGDTVRSNT